MSSKPNPIIISRGGGALGFGTRTPRIPGTFPSSVRYGEQVVSTGVPSLDCFLGGGIPLGYICIIKDVFPSRYADAVLKSFVAEGSLYNHHLFLAAGRDNCEEHLVKGLPSLIIQKNKDAGGGVKDDNLVNQSADDPSSALKIAWRYGHSSSNNSNSKDITKFEFSKKTSISDLGGKHFTLSKTLEVTDTLQEDKGHDGEALLQEIFSIAQKFKIPSTPTNQEKPPTNLLRICLSHCEPQVVFSPKFMLGLRSIVRHTNSCALITVSDVGGECSEVLLSRCDHFADIVVTLQAVTDERRRTDLGDIDGVCEFVKMESVNSLKTLDLPRDVGFTFKKKRLIFHELSLPPEGEDTAQREVVKRTPTTTGTTPTCGATIKGKSIDF